MPGVRIQPAFRHFDPSIDNAAVMASKPTETIAYVIADKKDDGAARSALQATKGSKSLSKDTLAKAKAQAKAHPLSLLDMRPELVRALGHAPPIEAKHAAQALHAKTLNETLPAKQMDVRQAENGLMTSTIYAHEQLASAGLLKTDSSGIIGKKLGDDMVTAIMDSAHGSDLERTQAAKKYLKEFEDKHFKDRPQDQEAAAKHDAFLAIKWDPLKMRIVEKASTLAKATEEIVQTQRDITKAAVDIKLCETLGHITRSLPLRALCIVPKKIRNGAMPALNVIGVLSMVLFIPDMFTSLKQRFVSNGSGGDQSQGS